MTKMIKMSLVAAVAVAGMTTVASAADVSYKGKLYVESFTETSEAQGSTGNTSDNGFEIDFDVTATAKINDNFSAVVGLEADTEVKGSEYSTGKDAVEAKDASIDDAHFVYANSGLAVKFGRQAIDTPTTDGELGEGVLAAYTMGNITAAAANFGNNEIGNSSDASAVALLGTAGPVNFQLWQVNVTGVNSNNTIVVGGQAGPAKVEFRHATTDPVAVGAKDGSTQKLVVSGKAGNVGVTGVYMSTDKDGAAFVTDPSSANTIEMTKLKGDSKADMSLVYVAGTMPLSAGYSVKVDYGTADWNKNDEASELRFQVNKSFAKSLKGSVQYATYDQKIGGTTTDKTFARADLTYKF